MSRKPTSDEPKREDADSTRPAESDSPTLFGYSDEGVGDSPHPSGISDRCNSDSNATITPDPTEAEPMSASHPFDLDAAIRSKQDRLEPKANTDPFDPARLRISPNYGERIGVKRLITSFPVRKPSKEAFVRTHPGEEMRVPAYVLELKEDQETYLVFPEIGEELANEATVSPRLLITTVNRAGVPFLWPVKLPGPDGKIDSWSRSAMAAADAAKSSWVRVSACMSLGGYEVAVATGSLAEPTWPDLTFNQILQIAFKDRVINSMDHPVLQRLRGEI